MHIERIQHDVRVRFPAARVLVVGDLMLDRQLRGEVARISPEAPVPVVSALEESACPGGAANVALNLRGLGCEVHVVGLVGTDRSGRTLGVELERRGVDASGLVRTSGWPTTTKLRVLGRGQQLLRIDDERVATPSPRVQARLRRACIERIAGVDAVIVSDYAKAVVTEPLCRAIVAEATARGVPVLVDPKAEDFGRYAGATAITPNRAELARATGLSPRALPEVLVRAAELRRRLGLEAIVATCAEEGIRLLAEGRTSTFPARAHEVFDVCGAGDTVVAVLTLGRVAGWSWDEAIEVANVAAGVVIGRVGTHPVTADELLEALAEHADAHARPKLLSRSALLERVRRWQAAGERVVLTNGCFDLLHVGHLAVLEGARRHGDRLVVAINSDASVRALKGASRPLVCEEERARMLAALCVVDAVIVFGELTPLELIRAVRPDVLVKGGDYAVDEIVGAELVRAHGGTVATVGLVEGRSTTALARALAQEQVTAWST